MISAIYDSRAFEVRDRQVSSAVYSQGTGIAQGCPLSPYLFIIVLTVVMADVDEDVQAVLGPAPPTDINVWSRLKAL